MGLNQLFERAPVEAQRLLEFTWVPGVWVVGAGARANMRLASTTA